MAPVYKFTYFDFMGVGESIRYLLHYGGVQYEHVVVNHNTTWPSIKPTVPFGKLPTLEVDGKVLYNPLAIVHYLARKWDLCVGDDYADALMDAYGETIYDLYYQVYKWHSEEDMTRKTYLRKVLETEIFPLYYTRFEKIVSSNNGYFYNGKLCWVDLFFVGMMDSIEGMWGEPLLKTKYNYLYKLYQTVYALPAIKAYISKRPAYEY